MEGEETALRWHWKLGYNPVQSGYFLLLDKLCFPSWTAKQRLQVLIPKEPHSVQLLVLVPSSEIWAKAISFSCWSVFFLVTFFERVRTVFFSVLTFGLPGGFVQITMYRLKRLLIPPGCIICSLSSRLFGPKCKVSEEHGFRNKATVSPLVITT